MTRALAVAGVLGAGSALVLWVAFLTFALVPSDRVVWEGQTRQPDLPFRRGPAVIVRPDPLGPNVQPWVVPVQPDPDVLVDPPVLIDPAVPEPIEPGIEG